MGGSFLTLWVTFSSTVSSLRLLSKLPHEWEERMNTIKADHPLFLWERGSLFVWLTHNSPQPLLAARKNEVRDQGKPLYYNSRKSTGIPAFRSCRDPALKFTDCKFNSECCEAAAQGFHGFPAAMLPSKYFWFALVWFSKPVELCFVHTGLSHPNDWETCGKQRDLSSVRVKISLKGRITEVC